MQRTLAVLAAASVAVAACTSDVDSPPPAEPADPVAADECAPELGSAFAAWADAGFNGTVAITTGGEPDCLAAYGTADPADDTPLTVDTVFGIGSVSKAFTAAAVVDLADRGALSLQDRAGDLVPGLEGPVAEATVEQLLLHTSGLTGTHGRDHEPLDRDEALAAISALELAFAPGAGYAYSNAGYTLLARIVEEVTGTDHRDVVASRVLALPGDRTVGGYWDGEPAAPGPRAVGVLDDGPSDQRGDFAGPHWALAGNGDLAMTTADLAAWTHALFAGQVVSPAAVEVISRPGFDHGDGSADTPGWVVDEGGRLGEPFLAAAGGGGDLGHDVVVAWLPDSERVVALASSTPDVTAEDLLQAVGPALVAGERLPVPDVPGGEAEVVPAEAAAVAGTYELDSGGSLAVAYAEGRLGATPTGPDAVAVLFPPPGDITLDDVTAHEDAVEALLAGETEEGRNELATLEEDVGTVERTEILGTVFDDGELRTYVEVTADQPITLWYALNDEGGIEAVDGPAQLPVLDLVAAEDGAYRPDSAAGAPEVTVTFAAGSLTVEGPSGPTVARMAG